MCCRCRVRSIHLATFLIIGLLCGMCLANSRVCWMFVRAHSFLPLPVQLLFLYLLDHPTLHMPLRADNLFFVPILVKGKDYRCRSDTPTHFESALKETIRFHFISSNAPSVATIRAA